MSAPLALPRAAQQVVSWIGQKHNTAQEPPSPSPLTRCMEKEQRLKTGTGPDRRGPVPSGQLLHADADEAERFAVGVFAAVEEGQQQLPGFTFQGRCGIGGVS